MASPTSNGFQEVANEGIVLLNNDIARTREERGRNFTTNGYILDIMNESGKANLQGLTEGAKKFYPFPKENYPYISEEAQTAIRGMLLSAQMVRLVRPTDFIPVVDQMASRLNAHTDRPKRPSGAQQLEMIGQSAIDQFGVKVEQIDSYHSMVHDPRELSRFRSVFGFGVSVFEEVSVLGSVSDLQEAADELARTDILNTSQIDWIP